MLPEFTFIPQPKDYADSNLFNFMKKFGIQTIEELHNKSSSDLAWFWDAASSDLGIIWDRKYDKVCDTTQGKAWAKWFLGGKINIYSSCVEKFLKTTPDKTALIFLSEDNSERRVSYAELDREVSRLANGLKSIGVQREDVVAIYMPMIAEAIFAILACAKIGAVQTVVFSGYSADALRMRLQDSRAKVLFTTNGFFRRGKPISQKSAVESALADTYVKKTIVVDYKGKDNFLGPDFIPYADLVKGQGESCKTEIMDSESPLFILYTSGTTGRPKGVLHVHGGFAVFAAHQSAYLIDQKKDDILFWPADIGWITGLTWNVYGTLETGSTALLYDGAPTWPTDERMWQIIKEYKITIFGTSPTAIRMIMANFNERIPSYDLSSIRIIATTGEPLDEETWYWLFERVGRKRCPIMNLSGGTEAGGAFLSVLPGMKMKPSTVGIPCPGIVADVFDETGKPVREKKGFLIIKEPWPAITRGLLNDNERYLKTYWSRFDNVWFHGDLASIDKDGLWFLHGRVDDVINISGHRISTAEIEESILSHPKIAEVAAISIPDKITGEALVIFVTLRPGIGKDGIEDEVRNFVSEKIGKLVRPKFIRILSGLPKTRTGKIMRRLLRAKLLGDDLGDISSLENAGVLDEV